MAGTLPLYVVTAWNPDGVVATSSQNHAAQQRLRERIEEAGRNWWPARGHDPQDPHHVPEEGVALAGLDRWHAIRWGAGFQQLAIFEISEDGLVVVPIAPRAASRPIYYHWVLDRSRQHVEIRGDYEFECPDDGSQRGYAYVKPFGYRVTTDEHDPVPRHIGELIVRAVAEYEVAEGFCLPV